MEMTRDGREMSMINDDVESAARHGEGVGEGDTSSARVLEFLQEHTAYELIPESNKVVVLDTALPVRQAFHAFYEQGIYAAPLWDESKQNFIGLLSAGDFIDIMRRLTRALADRDDLSDADLDAYTIQLVRDEYEKEGTKQRPLINVRPEDSLHHVALTMIEAGVHNVPVLSYGSVCPAGGSACASTSGTPQLLHVTNLAEILACLNRHFRGIPSALPLFSQPIGALPIGTWTERFGGSRSKPIPPLPAGVDERYLVRELYPIRAVTPDASIEDVFDVLHGMSALPIVNEHGVLMDLYARGDVIRLAANSAYRSIPLKELSVAQALGAARPTALTEQNDPSSTHYGRFSTCVRGDTLRTALEMLSLPNIRRLIVVDPTTKQVEGVVSLSDVFSFLIDNS